ncbi:MAG: pilus assembly protein TadG-related protein [Gemmataceae bacterium]
MFAPLNRRGSIAPLLALSSVALFSFVALAIDLGLLVVARTQCQNAADTAALTGTRILNNKPSSTENDRIIAEGTARGSVKSNRVLNKQFTDQQIKEIKCGLYRYDDAQKRFVSDFESPKQSGESWTSLRVTVESEQPSYFSKIFGVQSMTTNATAVAVHRPRDIAFVLDFSGSMRFGSYFNWSTQVAGAKHGGFHNPDPRTPQFGHYQRYQAYGTNPNLNPLATLPSDRPNPLYSTEGYVYYTGEIFAPANFTVETTGGPPLVEDFYCDSSNFSSPETPAVPVNPALLTKGFHVNSMPKPNNYMDQSGAYDGDRWPRKNGVEYSTSVSWDPTVSTGAARNLMEYLGWVGRYTTTSTPDPASVSRANYTPSSPAYSSNGSDFRDATWEKYGYDMDVADYRRYRTISTDPRNLMPANTTGGIVGQVKVTPGKFKGYSVGPSYWGKTFFIWPPDPRAEWDWRRKFFFDQNGVAFDPQLDSDPYFSGYQSINQALLANGTGNTVRPFGLRVNYPAVLKWIKSGPQVLPPNLRAGRILYYSSIPNDVDTSTGTPEEVLDKMFWKYYIDYVTGYQYAYNSNLAGIENLGWPESTTPSVLPTSEYTSGTTVSDPKPYMNYFDNPSRPRMHFWFGPNSMMSYLQVIRGNLFSGTVHEAQCWQLKAAINSVLDDIRNNHPNDFAGLCFFSHTPVYFKEIRAPMSQDFTRTKNALFYPFSLLPNLTPTSTEELRVYNDQFNVIPENLYANVPNSNGGTDPNSGFAMAYNLLSSSTNVNADPTKRGRRGASKVVIFETDGVPNCYQNWAFNSLGYESYYTNTGRGGVGGDNNIRATQPAFDIVTQICKPMAKDNLPGSDSGFSMPNTPARIYSIGFGDLFGNPTANQCQNAKQFLLDVQKLGGTSPPTATEIPAEQLIYGDYSTRISNMRQVLERIMQSGVQVTLIE